MRCQWVSTATSTRSLTNTHTASQPMVSAVVDASRGVKKDQFVPHLDVRRSQELAVIAFGTEHCHLHGMLLLTFKVEPATTAFGVCPLALRGDRSSYTTSWRYAKRDRRAVGCRQDQDPACSKRSGWQAARAKRVSVRLLLDEPFDARGL